MIIRTHSECIATHSSVTKTQNLSEISASIDTDYTRKRLQFVLLAELTADSQDRFPDFFCFLLEEGHALGVCDKIENDT